MNFISSLSVVPTCVYTATEVLIAGKVSVAIPGGLAKKTATQIYIKIEYFYRHKILINHVLKI